MSSGIPRHSSTGFATDTYAKNSTYNGTNSKYVIVQFTDEGKIIEIVQQAIDPNRISYESSLYLIPRRLKISLCGIMGVYIWEYALPIAPVNRMCSARLSAMPDCVY